MHKKAQICCLLSAFPRLTFTETGYHAWSKRPSWGASPDGLLTDAEMCADLLPDSTRASFPALDPQAGVVEFKASRVDCEVKG